MLSDRHIINCKVKRIDFSDLGLDWRMGPSTSNSTQWVNGATTSEQSYTYGYTVGNPVVQIPRCHGPPTKAS